MVAVAGLEPALWMENDFESFASTNSATPPYTLIIGTHDTSDPDFYFR